jgi:hypothetical protein
MGKQRLGRIALASTVVATLVAVVGQLPAAASLPPPAFVVRSVYSATNLSLGVRAGDLNGDGRDELVTWGTTTFASVRIGGADGSYSASFGVALGGIPTSVRLAHVDAGSTLDIVASLGSLSGSPTTTGVSVRLGNGDGTFAATIVSVVAAGSNPRTVAVADVTGDGKLDAVVGDSNSITIQPGNGTGTFATGVPVPAGDVVNDLAIADVTDDAKADIVATTTASATGTGAGTVRIFPGDGGGNLGTRVDRPIRDGASTLAVAQVDGDGRPDVVAAQVDSAGRTVALLLSQAGAPPAPAVDITLGTKLGGLFVADVDDDGKVDLVGTDNAKGVVLISHGRGDGSFAPPASLSAPIHPSAVVAANLVGGPSLDLAVMDKGSSEQTLALYPNQGAGKFAAVSRVPLAGPVTTLMTAADITGDGRQDILVANGTAGSELMVVPNDGKGQLLPVRTYPLPSTPTGMTSCRLDGDSWPDVIATTSAGITVLRGIDGTALAAPTSIAVGGTPSAVVARDLNGDGACDVAVTVPATGSIAVLFGNGTGSLGTPATYADGPSAERLIALDVDGDGDLDLATTNGPYLTLLPNAGAGTFPTHTAQPLADPAHLLVATDANVDGKEDVAVSTGQGAGEKILLALAGASGLGQAVTVASATGDDYFPGLAAGDVNNDGNPDLVMGASDIALGYGDGTFQWVAPTVALEERAAAVVAITDADGDGTSDLLGHPYNSLNATITRLPVTAPPWVPFDSWAHLIAQQYRDLLGRDPVAAESASAAAALRATSLTPGGLVAQLRGSTDNLKNVDPVVRLYRAYFLRNPDASGLKYWVSRRRALRTLFSISSSFARSHEFTRRYGTLTNRQFVELVYQNVLGRPGEKSGVDYWTRQLDTKHSGRGQVMLGFSESSEYVAKQGSMTNAAVLYLMLLGRAPTTAEVTDVVTALDAGTPLATVAAGILSSPAYAARIAAL